MFSYRRLCTVFASWLLLAGLLATPVAQPARAAARDLAADPTAPGVRPVPGDVVRVFAAPTHPYGPGHRGVDLRARAGAPVRVARAGIVTWAGPVAGTGYVTVAHPGGLDTTYADVDPAVSAGTHVRAGQRIGVVAAGATHLDWGARWDGGAQRVYIDPLTLLLDLRPVLVGPNPRV